MMQKAWFFAVSVRVRNRARIEQLRGSGSVIFYAN